MSSGHGASEAGSSAGARGRLSSALESAKGASERHIALAVPLRAVERNRRVAASVLAGGFAYRLFLWLLPFGLIVGGALGLMNARSTEDAVQGGGLPGAITNAVGDRHQSACPDSDRDRRNSDHNSGPARCGRACYRSVESSFEPRLGGANARHVS